MCGGEGRGGRAGDAVPYQQHHKPYQPTNPNETNLDTNPIPNSPPPKHHSKQRYERELRKLRAELQRRSKEVVDKRRLLEVEEQKRRAETEKLEVLKALEARSREFMAEKEGKRALEAKIAAMQGQLLVGGAKPEDSPTFRTLLAKVRAWVCVWG